MTLCYQLRWSVHYALSQRPLHWPSLPRRPCILIGSAFGALLSLLLLQVLPSALDLQPGVYAVVGATAMLGATFRSSISLVVIVVEGTRGIGAPGLRDRWADGPGMGSRMPAWTDFLECGWAALLGQHGACMLPSAIPPATAAAAELLFGVILAVIVSNWVAHHVHPDGAYYLVPMHEGVDGQHAEHCLLVCCPDWSRSGGCHTCPAPLLENC